jgi:potassium efflux system protein
MKKLLLISVFAMIVLSVSAQRRGKEVTMNSDYYLSVATVTVTEVSSFGKGYCILKLDNGYVGVVQMITPRVTYVKHGLNESIAIIPTRQLIAATIVNYSKDTAFVPAKVEVGASYLNDPEEVASVLMKVGQMAMSEIIDVRGRHLIVQQKCPYRNQRKPSCGCDKNILVDLDQPRVRVTNFNSSSIDFSVWIFVRDYGSQFKVESDMRIMIIKEFKKHNISIPWPIQTEYRGDLGQEIKEIEETEDVRKKTLKEYGTGDLNSSESKQDDTLKK